MAGLKKRVDIFINGKQATETIGTLKGQSRKLNNEINKLTPGTQKYINKVNELKGVNSQLDAHRKKVKGIGGAFSSLKGAIGGFLAGGAIIAVVGLITKGIGQWVKKNLALEKGLSSLKSITGATANDMKAYKKEAIEMGRTTTLSATQAVEGFKLIGSAKPELLKNKDALIEVTKQAVILAEAAELELGPASQSLAGTLNQFNLAADESSRVINVLAAGSKAGASDIIDLNASLEKTGTLAASMNITLEENVGVLELLGEKNIKGAEAGTQLNKVFLKMATIDALPPEALNQLQKFGVDTDVVSDKNLTLQQRLVELSKIQGSATALSKVFGEANVVTAQTILNNVEAVGGNVSALESYITAVTGTNVANEQAAINTDNLDGDLKSLSSAWEGLLLTASGSNGVLRPVIQVFTDILNTISDFFTAVKEGDSIQIENSFLKLGKALTYLNPFTFLAGDSVRELIDAKIRLNDLTSDVINGMRDEARAVDVLTSALGQNNNALANGNLTTEEANDLNLQNEDIIAQLQEKYPELTNEIDLQGASLEELSVFQKQVTQNLLKQAIESAKAAEQEKILNSIVQQSILLNKQRVLESTRSGFTNGVADVFADDSENIQESIDKEVAKLKNLENTFKQVENTVNKLDINYGADFDINSKLVNDAKKDLIKFENALKKVKKQGSKNLINAKIRAQKATIANSENAQTEILNSILKEKENKKVEEEITKNQEIERKKRAASRKKAANKRKREYDKLIGDLEKLTIKASQIQDEFDNKQKIFLLKTDEEKELAELEISLNKKYEKEIANAKKLAKEKGGIGTKANEQLKILEIIQLEELEFEKAIIQKKYAELEVQTLKENEKKKNEIELSLAKTTFEIKRLKIIDEINQLGNYELNNKKILSYKIRELDIEELDFNFINEIESLRLKLEDKEITEEEFRLRKEELELQHQESITAINDEADNLRKEKNKKAIEDAGQTINKVIDTIGKFREAQLNKDIKILDAQAQARINALDREFNNGLISREAYEAKKETIETETQQKIRDLKKRDAMADKTAAIIQATINTAVAVTKLIATPPLAVLAGLAGAAEIALISSQPTPQFKDGGYNVIGAQDGKSYNANMIGKHKGGMLPNTPSLILASEQGSEYYVPNHLLSDPRVAHYTGIIEAIRTNQMVDGGFSGGTSTNTQNDEQLFNSSTIDDFNKETDTLLITTLNELREEIQNINVVIGDAQVDEITDKQIEIAEIKG